MKHWDRGLRMACSCVCLTVMLTECAGTGSGNSEKPDASGATAAGAATSGGATGTAGQQSTGGAMNNAGTTGVSAGGAGGRASTGGSSNGGTTNTGGASTTGGAAGTGGAGNGVTGASASTISGWMDQLPYGPKSLTVDQRTQIIDAIMKSCAAFAPSVANWVTYCEAVVTGAILQESSYNAASVVTDSYGTRSISSGTANDPTVGLLQIRFSSTVNDYNSYGPLDKMAGIGCSWPPELASHQSDGGDSAFWAQGGGTTYLSFLESVPCNIGLATWYYFSNATGNGGPTAVYAAQYCQGKGVAASLPVGLLSHLQGPAGPHPPDTGNSYVTNNKKWFTLFLGTVTPDPYSLTTTLSPEPSKYCR
jgi:hypothetical protein